MNETDEMIYSRYLSKHNEDDFRILLQRHRESLTLFLMSFVHNMEDAEELMLDTYAQVAAGGSFLVEVHLKPGCSLLKKKKALMFLRKKHFTFSLLEEHKNLTADSLELELFHREHNQHLY